MLSGLGSPSSYDYTINVFSRIRVGKLAIHEYEILIDIIEYWYQGREVLPPKSCYPDCLYKFQSIEVFFIILMDVISKSANMV